MVKKAIVPLSFHENENQISSICSFLKMQNTRRVVVVHVGRQQGRAGAHNHEQLEEYSVKIREHGFEVETAIRSGAVSTAILFAADEFKADIIGITFKKKSWLTRTILGSTVKDVTRQSDIPVFVHKKEGRRQRNDRVFRVLYATSLQGRDERILSFLQNGKSREDELVLLYVGRRAPDPVVEQKRKDTIDKELASVMALSGYPEENTTFVDLIGSPRKHIVKVAKRFSADLVLLGKSDTTSSSGPVLGSTAEEVSYNAPCSVLIVPKRNEPAQLKEEEVKL